MKGEKYHQQMRRCMDSLGQNQRKEEEEGDESQDDGIA